MSGTSLWLKSMPVQELLNMLVDRLDAAEQRGSAKAKSVQLDERTWPALYMSSVESRRNTFGSMLSRWCDADG